MEFYQELCSQLQRKKLKLYRTVWLGAESNQQNQLRKLFNAVAQAIERNMISGVTFIVGFLNHNDFRLKLMFSLTQNVFGKKIDKILWIFPVIHLDFSNMLSFPNGSQVLAFQETNSGTVYCSNIHDYKNCALRLVLEKTADFLESRCWKKVERRGGEVLRENNRISGVQKLGYRLRYFCSVVYELTFTSILKNFKNKMMQWYNMMTYFI